MEFVSSVVRPARLSGRPLVFLCTPQGLAVRREGAGAQVPSLAEAEALGVDLGGAHYLGRLGDEDCLTLAVDQAPPPLSVEGLRQLHGVLPDDVFFVAGRAVQVAHWAQTHRFCGRCGAATSPEPGERAMKCPRCQLTAYPRLSPAVIVLVRRGEEALLARSARFPIPFFSTLAGFVEVGESLEQTLVREVREEVGIQIARPVYFGSQPWPFPHSLMLGFHADYAGGELRPDGEEIVEARWFRRDALPLIPPPLSIARKLIDAWVQGTTRSSL